MERELRRQLFHIVLGLATITFLLLFGRGMLMGATFFTIIIGLILINQAFLGKKIGLVEWFIRNFERKDVRFPGWGSACYATGVLLLCSFLSSIEAIAASILIIAIGDGLATIAGRTGKYEIPYNRKKKIEGSAALFFFSLVGYLFIGPLIIPASLIAVIVESLPIPVDDNITIPVALILFFMVV